MFPHDVWSVHSRTEAELPRTNNNVEGWNRKMQAAIACNHPNLWRFITVLKREYGVNNMLIDQALGGHAVPPPRKKYRCCNTRIVNIVEDFTNRNHLDFLRGIALNLQF